MTYSAEASSRSGSSGAGVAGDVAARSVGIEIAPRLERVDDAGGGLLHRLSMGSDLDLRRQRRLVRIIDAGEALQLAASRLGVQPLDVPRLAHLQRGGDVDLEEALAGQRPDLVTDGPVRRDRRRDHLDPVP